MKRFALLFILLLGLLPALPVQAQTATPTFPANANVLSQGDYPFDTSAYFVWVGSWSNSPNGQNTVRTSSATHAWVDFQVSEHICTMVISGDSTNAAGLHVIVENGNRSAQTYTAIVGTTSSVGFTYPINLDSSNNNGDMFVRIKSAGTGAGTIILWYLRLLECPDLPTPTPPNTPVYTATPQPTSTPANTPVDTATAVPTGTPPNTPVPTATILPSSTPGVPTATILPSSTPGVPTATILPSSTPANTPVDTPTEINTPVDTPTAIVFPPTPTEISISDILTALALPSSTPGPSPTPTDTPTETHTPTLEPWVYITVTTGQMTRFDYVATASDVHIANLLALIVFSVWGMFLFSIFVVWRSRR